MNTSSVNKKIMARNIKKYLEMRSINSKQLAEYIGLPYSTVLSWVQGKTYPRIDKIELLCKYFGCQKSDLVEDKSEVSVVYYQEPDLNEIIELYKGMNQQGKDMLLMTARSFSVSYPKKNNLNRMDEAK